jgi:hypothetical protein
MKIHAENKSMSKSGKMGVSGYDSKGIQRLKGKKNVNTTMRNLVK